MMQTIQNLFTSLFRTLVKATVFIFCFFLCLLCFGSITVLADVLFSIDLTQTSSPAKTMFEGFAFILSLVLAGLLTRNFSVKMAGERSSGSLTENHKKEPDSALIKTQAGKLFRNVMTGMVFIVSAGVSVFLCILALLLLDNPITGHFLRTVFLDHGLGRAIVLVAFFTLAYKVGTKAMDMFIEKRQWNDTFWSSNENDKSGKA
ncbi:hypothetical protein [Nitrospina watsonii]|uniref:Uncharacterized protein n=1 Tax=Nitrospina watsonii TaxID=1323948 RepID=A0ABN8W012_9BACT|nr:hypothetical protein [Nitrospina watsonii]CAI2717504.1 membrane protein of unknown function [Nitrospina watsonii]